MRHKRPTSQETKAALNGIVKAVALEMDVSDDYLYAILAGGKPDSYANFKAMFRAAARVSALSAREWYVDLGMILRAEEARQGLMSAPRYTGCAKEVRRETREAADAAIDDRPIEEQIRETCEAIESLEARLLSLLRVVGQVK